MKKIVWPILTAVHFLAACGGSFFLFCSLFHLK